MKIFIIFDKIMKLTVIRLGDKFMIFNPKHPKDKRVAQLFYSDIAGYSINEIKKLLKELAEKHFEENVIRLDLTKEAKDKMKEIASKNN